MIPRSQVSFGISHGSYASRRAVGSVYSALGTRRTRRDRAGGDLGRRDQGEGKTKAAAGEWRHGSKSRAGKERVLMKKCCWRAAPPPPPPPPRQKSFAKRRNGLEADRYYGTREPEKHDKICITAIVTVSCALRLGEVICNTQGVSDSRLYYHRVNLTRTGIMAARDRRRPIWLTGIRRRHGR